MDRNARHDGLWLGALCVSLLALGVLGLVSSLWVGAIGVVLKLWITWNAFQAEKLARSLAAEHEAEQRLLQSLVNRDLGPALKRNMVASIRRAQESVARASLRSGVMSDAEALPEPFDIRPAIEAVLQSQTSQWNAVVSAMQDVGLRCVSREELDLSRVEATLETLSLQRQAGFDRAAMLVLRIGFGGSLAGIVGQTFIAGYQSAANLLAGSFLIGILVAGTTTIQGLLVYLFIEHLRARSEAAARHIGAQALVYARQFILPSFNDVPNDPVQVKNIVEGAVDRLVELLEQTVERLNASMGSAVGDAAGEGRQLIREALSTALGEHLLDPTKAIMAELRQHLIETRQGLEATAQQMLITSEQLAQSAQARFEAPDVVVAAVRSAAVNLREAANAFALNSERLEQSSGNLADNLREASRHVEEVALAVGNRADVRALGQELRAAVHRLEGVANGMTQTTNQLVNQELDRQETVPPFHSDVSALDPRAPRRGVG